MRNCRMRGRKSYSWFPLSDVIFLSDKAFSQVCYRTLVAYNGGAFLGGIAAICGEIFICINVFGLEKCGILNDIRSEKCNNSCIFAWKNVFSH